jgi:predicted nucleic-acid-binding protein
MTVADEDRLLRSIEVYEVQRIDFAGGYLVASAERTGVNEVCSFDQSVDRLATVDRVQPPPVA